MAESLLNGFRGEKQLNECTMVNREQFGEFLSLNPLILEAFKRTFREELWSFGQVEPEPEVQTASSQDAKAPTKNGNSSGGCMGGKGKPRLQEVNRTNSFFSKRKQSTKEGYLLKKGKKMGAWKRRYFLLKEDVLYYYRSKATKLPAGLVFMRGCFCQKKDVGDKFGISISNAHLELFMTEESERDDWFDHFLEVSQQGDVEKKYKFEEEVGSGRFSKVYRAVDTLTQEEVAIKVI